MKTENGVHQNGNSQAQNKRKIVKLNKLWDDSDLIS